jgi:Chaperone of endosialidase/Secretion system C-terminal sorting domain
MKKAIMIFALATGIGVNGFSQVNVGSNLTNIAPVTNPANISQLEVRGRLITQNAFVGLGAIPAGQQTGEFGANARWNSMGSIPFNAVTPNLTQTINGFRTQTDGKGLAWGYSIPAPGQPNAGVASNPFIEWIGNNTLIASDPSPYTPGNLEFRYALSPTGAASARIPIFTMAPSTTGASNTSNSYAQNGLLGHYENTGASIIPSGFGTFGANDKWIGIGNPPITGSPLYGSRTYWSGFSLSTAIRNDAGQKNAIIEWGGDQATISGLSTSEMKFRYFSDNTNPAASVQALALRPTGTSYFGNTISNNFTNPFVEINAARRFLSEGLAVNLPAVFNAPSIQSGIKVKALQLLGSVSTLYGVNSLAQNGNLNYGTYSLALDGTTNYGVFARAESSHDNYGVYSEVVGGNNNIAGYFNGAVVTTTGFYNVSDKRFKKDIQKETSVLESINKINVVTYLMDREKFPTLNLSDKINHGFIAQELEEIFPELVKDVKHPIFKNGEMVEKVELKAVNYIELIPVLTKAIQELSAKVETLETQLKSTATKNTFVLTDKTNLPAEIENKAFTLSQNTPNPFSEKTTISYTIPSNVSKATLAIFDLTGKMLLQYNLQQGKNIVVVNGSTLQAGMYLYSLLADGQEVMSKRMVLTK